MTKPNPTKDPKAEAAKAKARQWFAACRMKTVAQGAALYGALPANLKPSESAPIARMAAQLIAKANRIH